MTIRIPAHAIERVGAHLCRAYPEEGCGVLLGNDRDAAREVEDVIGFENRREDSRHNRYLISPDQFLAAEKEARSRGLDVVGFFHSHPDHPARPSAFDLEHAWPFYSYLIVSVERGRIAATTSWRLDESRSTFEPETIETVPQAATLEPGGERAR
jgi:proteasome lid subunit RPN8/RPN11